MTGTDHPLLTLLSLMAYTINHVVLWRTFVLLLSLFPSHCRIWDIECGASLRLLEGHDELVRCIRFDDRKIVSGAYDG